MVGVGIGLQVIGVIGSPLSAPSFEERVLVNTSFSGAVGISGMIFDADSGGTCGGTWFADLVLLGATWCNKHT